MKKWILGFLITIAVIVGSVWFYDNCYLPEFKIVSIIKSGSDNFTSVYLNVQVNRWFYDTEKMEKKVKRFYSTLNGEPEQWNISFHPIPLYQSKIKAR